MSWPQNIYLQPHYMGLKLQRPSVVSLLPCLETFVFGIQWTPPIYGPRQEALNYIFYKTVFLLNIALTLHPAAGLVALVSANLSSYWIGLVVPHDILQNGADTKILLIRVILKYQCWVFVSTQNGIYLSLYWNPNSLFSVKLDYILEAFYLYGRVFVRSNTPKSTNT